MPVRFRVAVGKSPVRGGTAPDVRTKTLQLSKYRAIPAHWVEANGQIQLGLSLQVRVARWERSTSLFPTAFRRWVPSPRALHFVPLGGPASVITTPAKRQGRRALSVPRGRGPGRAKGRDCGHVAERHAFLRGWFSDTDSTLAQQIHAIVVCFPPMDVYQPRGRIA